MVIGDNAAVHTEAVSTTNNIGDDGISTTTVTPVAGDTYGLDIDNLKIARTAGGGIDGAGGGNIGLHVNNTEIINPGDAGTPSSTSSDEDAIGYGSGFVGNADQLSGTVLIENSTFAAFIDHGFQIENSGSGTANVTISNVTMKNNDGLTLCSGGPCEGSAIQVIADGSTVAGGAGPTINLTVKELIVTNIDQDGIDAIADPGGNINVTVGDPANNATAGLTFNCPNGDQVLRFNSGSPDSDDVATFNFNVRNVIVQQSLGTLVIFKAANQMTGKFINSTLDANDLGNTLASRGIEITADGDASGGANEVPAMTILIDNVTLNRIGGDGIQAFMTDVTNSASRLDLTIQNSNIGTNPANTAQTGLEIGKNNSLASEGIELRNGVTAGANGEMYVHLLNNNVRNATSLSGSADGIDIDAEQSTTSHVTVVNNDVFAAPGTTDYDLAVEVNTAFMCADFTGNTDSNDANSGADITNIGDTADFQIEGGFASLAGNNPGTSPFNQTGTFATGTCTMPNTPSGGFFALKTQLNQPTYLASLTTRIANDLPANTFASAENTLTIATLPATMTQPSLPTLNNSLMAANALPSNKTNKTDARRSHHAQFNRSRSINASRADDQPLVPTSGEAVGPINIGTLPAGKSVTIIYAATVDTPPTARQASHQGTVTYTGGPGSPLLTDDPDVIGANNPTVTLIDTTTTWDGSTSTDWNDATNWVQGFVPNSVSDVVIPNGALPNEPNINTTDVNVFSLDLQSDRTLSIQTGRILTINTGLTTLAGELAGGPYTLNFVALTINRPTGITLNGPTAVSGVLTLTSGNVSTGANVLTLGSASTIVRTSGHIIGTLKKINVTTGFVFTVGTAVGYTPLDITSASGGGDLTVTTVDAPQPTLETNNPGKSLTEYWTLTEGGTLTANMVFHYLQSDVPGTSNEANYRIIRVIGPATASFPQNCPTTSCVDTTANTFTISGVSNFSDWTVGEVLAPTASGGVVTGRIVDDSGSPVEGAVVRLNGAQNRKFITDANGFYRFENVETNGFYTVTPSRANYTFSPQVQSFTQLGESTEASFGATLSSSGLVNPLDTPEFYVRQHYLDFLGREPDEAGFNFWSDQILSCGGDNECVERRRENVSAAYFLSIEFQQTGGLVDGLNRASFG
ncbi:MAG: carboxypeptidase regulatory-like domain-containing protein, partial [Acidobacteria bacterium]|nr:carboxypeptidase regulatory-like domain-containing protein [Acidobacteriota bacterium]